MLSVWGRSETRGSHRNETIRGLIGIVAFGIQKAKGRFSDTLENKTARLPAYIVKGRNRQNLCMFHAQIGSDSPKNDDKAQEK